MAPRKSPPKSPPKERELILQPNGGMLYSGGTNKGGTGRPKGSTTSLKAFLAKLRQDPQAHAALERAAKDDAGRNFGHSWRLASEYDEEKPVQKQGIQFDGTITVKFVRE